MKGDTQSRDDDVDCWQAWILERVGGLVVSDRRYIQILLSLARKDGSVVASFSDDLEALIPRIQQFHETKVNFCP
ncbi:hypothetical protein Y032_0017g3213 [Ancylostoma ceylanicum]|uniref:Uncharacterized protein n=1 Tax=Ancylostoma ceylanicum TaxID=53326 RepID=A0A016V654_9BILA|nr:hypothetical protein Y032_0017g3213 [Ancylostoma ceylanicum]